MAKQEKKPALIEQDTLWYKKAVIYQCHVRAFCDSDGNGMGDFRGLTQKLDYLQELGVTAIWLLPFYPSPLRDDGYDIADYYRIHPDYGVLPDFKIFLKEAHRRDLRVITELVINHTSDQHPWFQRSRRAKAGSVWRDFYVWSDTAEKYRDARIIFKDFETSNWTWDPVANAHFWHRFYSHQPDLNFDNLAVHKELIKILDFWLDMGVDGLRLDAVPYLYEREGTNCENLKETHEFLKKLRTHVDAKYGDRMLLAEANQWPDDAVEYFGQGTGDECHMAFHFPVMPRLFMGVRMEDRVPIVDILEQTPGIPETGQWALFLRNHDELTLEMVTDEERDYMYRMYAHNPKSRINLGIRRRLAPLLNNDRKRIELLNALLFSLPGTPVIYYGDEIGMGENIYLGDRNGVRTPMQWSSDRNAGFSRANPQGLYLPIIVDAEYHYEAINVEAQEQNPNSLLWWMRRMLSLRKHWTAFGQGTMRFLQPDNRKILAYVRECGEERVVVVANLSRFVQPVSLDLSEFAQMVPIDIFGMTPFPPIGEQPYFLTMGPHAFFWFSLEPRFAEGETLTPDQLEQPALALSDRWETGLKGSARTALEKRLAAYVKKRRWFGGKSRQIKALTIKDVILVPAGRDKARLALLEVDYVQGDPEIYALAICYMEGESADALLRESPHFVITKARMGGKDSDGILCDAVANPDFNRSLLDVVAKRRVLKGAHGEIVSHPAAAVRSFKNGELSKLEPSVGRAEQSNTAVIFGDQFIFKLFRKLEAGVNPDLEIGRFLTERNFAGSPALAGTLEYREKNGDLIAMGIMHRLVANSKDAWEYTLDALGRYYERVLSMADKMAMPPGPVGELTELAHGDVPHEVLDIIGTYAESARQLGERTAEMHVALSSDVETKDFAPEAFTPFYQRSLYQSLRNRASDVLQAVRKGLKEKDLGEEVRENGRLVADLEEEILKRFRAISERRITAKRIRIHGDFHLGQVLHTGKDFMIIDYEGEPARSLSERRIKRSAIKDVAGMLRSFHYATYALLYRQLEHGLLNDEQFVRLEPWTNFWVRWVSVLYLHSYLTTADRGDFLPTDPSELKVLLETNLLDKAIYELGYELNNRPGWLPIPVKGILHILQSKE